MTIQKRILLIVTVLAVGWVVLNLKYFSKNIQYYVAPDTVAENFTEVAAEKVEPNLLFIDSLGIRAPINYVDKADEDVFQESLQTGVVHYPGTAKLGENGNTYIFGHSSDNAWAKGDYKTVFALLPQIEIGQEIIASDEQGNKYVYIARETKIISPDDVSVLEQGNRERKLLTVQTSYPVGTALKRFVVIAELAQ